MQGAFPALGADWQAALDPGVDDDAQRRQRSDQIDRQLRELVRLRDGQAPAAAAPPDPLRYTQVEPPTPNFRLNGLTFYILKQTRVSDVPAREGKWGHYLVTTVDIQANPGFARPMNVTVEIAQANRTDVASDGPGMQPAQGDTRLKPDDRYCIPFSHYIVPTVPASYYEVGLQILKNELEKAEALDLAFARRMEGLGNVAPQVCWDCLDPDYDPSDRPAVMDQFMARYLSKFYDGLDPEGGPATNLVVDEALHKHKAFCQAWAKKHYKTLTPAVTAPAEALASEFYPYLQSWFPENQRLTHMELARVLMRHEDTAAEFATCLHFYGTSLEQARGGRNASYKQMSTVTTYRAVSHKRFGDLLAAKMLVLRGVFQKLGSTLHDRLFHHLVVDWHTILGQMPQTHRFFENTSLVKGLLRAAPRNRADAAHVPPWRTMRPAG